MMGDVVRAAVAPNFPESETQESGVQARRAGNAIKG
jgi:hypothetical protein